MIFTLAASLAYGCAGGPTQSQNQTPEPLLAGDHEFSLEHDGRDRYYIVRIPSAAASGPALPLVLALHGGGGNPNQFKRDSGFDVVADREGFIVVFPAGTGPPLLPRMLQTWNAGPGCCGTALNENVDDVGFLLAVVADLASRTPVDSRRVYATGHSNGGMMSYRLAAEAGDEIAAIAPVAGGMMLDDFLPNRAVPLLHIHSVDDPRALYEGGLGPPFPLGGNQVFHQPVMEGLDSWVTRNGCPPTPETIAEVEGAPGTLNEGHAAVKLAWLPCSSGAPVLHWRMAGVGHAWPGSPEPPLSEELVGPPTTILSAPEEAWAFFRDHALP